MILKSNRLFERKEPERDAHLIVIYCEGIKRERDYFFFFTERSSKLKLEVVELSSEENNSPMGLFAKAKTDLVKSTEEPCPKYELNSEDEVWFVIDTDSWGAHISDLRRGCAQERNWFVAQSNPCFEVWLCYHFLDKIPKFHRQNIPGSWKKYLDSEVIPGGFNSKTHPMYIDRAVRNSKRSCPRTDDIQIGQTSVFVLAEAILKYVNIKSEK